MSAVHDIADHPTAHQTHRRGLWQAPPERLAVVRIAVFSYAAVYLTIRSVTIIDIGDLPASRFDGVGGVFWLDSPLSPMVLGGLLVGTVVTCAMGALGWNYRLSAPAATLGVLVILSHRLSWGQVLHTENLIVMHTAILSVVPAADRWSLDHRRCRRRAESPSTYGWALQLMAAVVGLSYVVAAWAKIRNGGLDWISGEVLRNHIAHDNLRKHLLGDVSSPIAPLLLRHRWLFGPMAFGSIVVELAAPLAVLGSRRMRYRWVGAIWGFHAGILALMAILFPYQLLFFAFLPFIDGERLVSRAASVKRRVLASQREEV